MPDDQKPAGTPNGAAGAANDLPEWLSKIPGVDMDRLRADTGLVNDIKGYGLRQDDYTKKTQEIAPLRKLKERLGDGVDLEKELDRVYQRDAWLSQNWPTVESQLNRLTELERQTQDRPNHQAPTAQVGQQGGFDISTDDLFENERLRGKINGLQQHIVGQAQDQMKKWYEGEELPRLDRQAQQYMATVLGLVRTIWPKDLEAKGVTIERLLREGAITREPFHKIAAGLTQSTEQGMTEAEARGYERAKRELEATHSTTPAPPAMGVPNWRRPPDAPKKGDRNGMFQSVMADVEKRHGALPR